MNVTTTGVPVSGTDSGAGGAKAGPEPEAHPLAPSRRRRMNCPYPALLAIPLAKNMETLTDGWEESTLDSMEEK
jgi:hypothetical protein